MGSDYKKPDATTVITQENYENILWPLDIRDLFFVGKATADKLQGIGIHTIGQLAESDRHTVTALLGKRAALSTTMLMVWIRPLSAGSTKEKTSSPSETALLSVAI